MVFTSFKKKQTITAILSFLIVLSMVYQNLWRSQLIDSKYNENLFSIYYRPQNSEINTTLVVLLNDTIIIEDNPYQFHRDELLNITAIYSNETGSFIENADVEIVDRANLTRHPLYNQYNVTINSNDLDSGPNILNLTAQKDNYQSQIFHIIIQIIDKETDMHLFLNGENKTIDRTLSIPIMSMVNITVKYFDTENGNSINGATVQVLGEGLSLNLTENLLNQQYSISINTSLLGIGIKLFTIFCQKINYQPCSLNFIIEVNRIRANISTVSGETVFNLKGGDDYRLQICLTDLDFNVSILNATVIYSWAYGQGNLSDDDNDGIYEAIISDIPVGSYQIRIIAFAEIYDFEPYYVNLNAIAIETDISVFLNGENKTLNLTLSISIRKMLNITVNYLDIENGNPISGATVQAIGEGLSLNLTENLLNHQYYISINTSLLGVGERNLTIYCTKVNYRSYSASLRIQVDKIRTNVSTFSGETIFSLKGGDDFTLQIQLTNLDLNVSILNAIVNYSWQYGQGNLTDDNNDGIYETIISDIPIGLYQVEISVYAGDDYNFEHLYLTLNVIIKQTGINLLLDGKTNIFDQSFTIPIGKILNITIKYYDIENGNPITGANISIAGEGLLLNLTENALYNQYSISIDTNFLGVGITALWISCENPNCQSQFAVILINVVEKVTFAQILTVIGIVAGIGTTGFVISYLTLKYKKRLKDS